MRLDLLWKKSSEDSNDSCSHEDTLESAIGGRIDDEKRKITELRHNLDFTRRIVLTRQQLERSRLENNRSLVAFEETASKARNHLAYLSTVFCARVKKKHPMSFYRKALTKVYDDGDTGEKDSKKHPIPPPYVFDQQAKLLECFHRTEIFRSQWEIASEHLLRTTQQLMHDKSRLKDRNIKLEFEPISVLFNELERDVKPIPEEEGKKLAPEKRHDSEDEKFAEENRGDDKDVIEEEKIEMIDNEMSESWSNEPTSMSTKKIGLNADSVSAEVGKKQAALLWGENGKKETTNGG